jgi:hypothetical protein
MKAIFPCKGTMIIYKQDLTALEAFYKSRLITSKLSAYAKISTETLQVGNLNYLPNNSNLILDTNSLLSLNKLKEVLNIEPISKTTNNQTENLDVQPNLANVQRQAALENSATLNNEEDLIDDKDILSNPFFQTLKPLE